MRQPSEQRRRLLQAGLAAPLISTLPVIAHAAVRPNAHVLPIPATIQQAAAQYFGEPLTAVMTSSSIALKVPSIAENGAVVPVTVMGDSGIVTELAVFVEKNRQPLAGICRLHNRTDLNVGFRLKLSRTSDVYVIAKTADGLIGERQAVKVTIGCMGG